MLGLLPFFHQISLSVLLTMVTLIGVAGASVLGTVLQLTSILPTSQGKGAVAFLMGTKFCGLVLLGLSTATGFNKNQENATTTEIITLFWSVAGVQAVAVAFFYALSYKPLYLRAMAWRDSKEGQKEIWSYRSVDIDVDQASNDEDGVSVWAVIWPCALSLIFTVFASITAFPFFTYVPSDNANMASNLFYCQTIGEAVGTQLAVWLVLFKSPFTLLACCFVRICMTVLMVMYILVEDFPRNDIVFYIIFSFFFICHGYFIGIANTAMMELVEQHEKLGKAFVPLGMKLMTVCFLGTLTVGVLVGAGLVAAFTEAGLIADE